MGGAGKTTLAGMIQKETGCNVIHMDHFFLQPGQRTKERLDEPGGNVDYERVRKEVLIPLSQGKAFAYQPFDCKSMELAGEIKMKLRPEAVPVFRDRWIPLEERYFSVYRIQERCSMAFNNKFV